MGYFGLPPHAQSGAAESVSVACRRSTPRWPPSPRRQQRKGHGLELTVSTEPGGGLLKILDEGIRDSGSLGIAVAYVTGEGLGSIEDSLGEALDRNGSVQIVHGADGAVTDPDVIGKLRDWSLNYPGMGYRVQFNRNMADVPLFHPKLYWYERLNRMTTCIIGSSNLTGSGFSRNVEANAIISGPPDSTEIRKCRKAFDGLFGNQDLIEPSDLFVEMYRQIHDRERWQRQWLRRDNELASLYAAVGEFLDNERERKQSSSWTPITQLDMILLALQRAGPDAELQLEEIYAKARMIAVEFGRMEDFDPSAWPHSLRRCINTNTTGKADGKMLFERVGGENSRSGRYRLSTAGSRYSGKA